MTRLVSSPYQGLSVRPYTGIETQPDTVSIFYKDNNKVEFADEAIVNTLGHSPSEFLYGIHRIQLAAEKIFEIIRYGSSEAKDDLLNAFKNLGRGLIQLVPLAGNGVLYLYDKIRTNFFVHPHIKAALADEKGAVIGIAFDGKIIAKFSSEKLKTADSPIAVSAYCWLHIVKNAFEGGVAVTKLQLVEQFQKVLQKNYS